MSERRERTLGAKVGRGLAWSTVNTIIGRVGQLFVGIVLARLIAPSEFGVFAAALVVLSVVISVSELGVSVAIVQAKDREEVDRIAPVVTTLSVASGVGLGALMALLAPWLAQALGAPAATGPIRVLALSLVIAGLSATPSACIQREFLQDRKLIADTVSFAVTTAVAIAMASAGFGAWSLAWSRVIGNIVLFAFTFALAPKRYRPAWDAALARRLLLFGLPLAGASIVVFAVMNVDYAVIGNVLGPTALGIYVLAFNLSGWPVGAFSATVRAVSLPAFSELRADTAALPGELRPGARHAVRARGARLRAARRAGRPARAVRVRLPLVRRRRAAGVPGGAGRVTGGPRARLRLPGVGGEVQRGAAAQPAVVRVARPHADRGGPSRRHHRGGRGSRRWRWLVVVMPAFMRSLSRLGVTTASIIGPISRPLLGGALMALTALAALAVVPTDFAQLAVGGLASALVYGLVVGLPLWRQHQRGELFRVAAPAPVVEVAA